MSKFSKIAQQLQDMGFAEDRVSGNNHALFRHGKVTEFKLTVPRTPKSYGALEVPLKKAELFNALLESGLRYVEAVRTNILFQHRDDPSKVITIPSRPKGLGALRQALSFAQEINAELAEKKSAAPEFNSKAERKAWRKSQWKPGYSTPG